MSGDNSPRASELGDSHTTGVEGVQREVKFGEAERQAARGAGAATGAADSLMVTTNGCPCSSRTHARKILILQIGHATMTGVNQIHHRVSGGVAT